MHSSGKAITRLLLTLSLLASYSVGSADLWMPTVQVTHPNICTASGVKLVFSGTVELPRKALSKLASVEFVASNQAMASVDTTGDYHLVVPTSRALSVPYRIVGVLANNERFIADKGNLEVVNDDSAPLRVERVDYRDAKSMVIKLAGSVRPRQAYIVMRRESDGQGDFDSAKASYDTATRQLTASTANLAAGRYLVRVVALTSDGQYISPASTLTVDEFVNVRKPTEGAEIVVKKEQPSFTVDVTCAAADGQQVDIKLDQKTVGHAPIASGSASVDVDFANVTSGRHTLRAFSAISGVVAESNPISVNVTNTDMDARVEEAHKEARRESVVAPARRLHDALYSRNGEVGHIRGLSVAVIGSSIVFGKALPLSLVITKATAGKGSVMVNGKELDASATESIMNALLYAEKYVSSRSQRYRWRDYDYVMVYETRAEKIEGDSAGAAIATLVISCLTRQPIRSEVAITGTVSADGKVGEVGGYSMKSFAAFSDPGVLTLIIPKTSQALTETLALPPAFVAGHRIIAVTDMSQVLRQALLCDDANARAADQYAQAALDAFIAGEVKGCVEGWNRVYQYTPEDMSPKLWWEYILKNGM